MYSILISFIMKQNKNPGGCAGILLSIFGGSVMEQADVRHGHRHVVFVGRLDDIVVADGAAGLGDIGHAALVGALDVVAEREEGIGAEGDASLLLEPGLFPVSYTHLTLPTIA